METIESICEFWFGDSLDDSDVAVQKSRLWWSKDLAMDETMRRRFAPYLPMAGRGDLDGWAATAIGRLALIVVADQFPRNIYRDTFKAFSMDAQALSWCKVGIAQGDHMALRPIERVFFYLPLEHAESLQDQTQSVSLFEALVAEAKPAHKAMFNGFLQFAYRHREIIARFGRFPHRNRLLNRESTSDERIFLTKKGSSF